MLSSGADDQNRTGDLVLTKDALCQLSYIGLDRLADVRSHRRRSATSASCWLASRARRDSSGRRLERETGIEPATNSLEGCDSTTELLPPSRSRALFARASAGIPAASRLARQPPPRSACQPSVPARRTRRERRLVAREGLEPSKPLGRQIYSLLRLTASLPRQLVCCVETRCFDVVPATGQVPSMELAKGFEPPTC